MASPESISLFPSSTFDLRYGGLRSLPSEEPSRKVFIEREAVRNHNKLKMLLLYKLLKKEFEEEARMFTMMDVTQTSPSCSGTFLIGKQLMLVSLA